MRRRRALLTRPPMHLWLLLVAAAAPPTEVAGPVDAAFAAEPERLRVVEGVERFKYRGEVPDGFHLVEQPHLELRLGGVLAFAVGYATTVAVSGIVLRDWWGLIPAGGPLFSLVSQLNAPRPQATAVAAHLAFLALYSVLTVVQTVIQLAGLVMIVVSLVKPLRWLERGPQRPTVTFLPGAPGAALGASVTGRF